jgi:hypothetical protein
LLDHWAEDEALSQHMRWQLRRASSVVAQTDWENAAASLGASNARLLMLIDASIRWIECLDGYNLEPYNATLVTMQEAIAERDQWSHDLSSFEIRNDVNVKLRAAIASFLTSLEADEREGFRARRHEGLMGVFQFLDEL